MSDPIHDSTQSRQPGATPKNTEPQESVLDFGDWRVERFANWWRPNLIWFVPILAACIAVWLMLNLARNQGPAIEISFRNAEGIEAGKTRVKYKSVDIGMVRSLALNADRTAVLVNVELDKSAEGLLAKDSRFWIVRPRITAGEISGLGTLISGAYIGTDFGKSNDHQHSFIGLETPPIITADLAGRQFILHANDLGSLDIGSPIYYRRIPVGEVVGYGLDKDGRGVSINFFIHAPYDQYVTESSRFWHASGVDVAVDATGIRVNTQSLTSVVLGGIAFDNPLKDITGRAIRAIADHSFKLQPNRQEAFKRPDGEPLTHVLYFPGSVRGLTVGAPVDFRGVVIGEVTAIGADLNPNTLDYNFPVQVSVYPARLRARSTNQTANQNASQTANQPDNSAVEIRKVLDHMVAKGLRAQLRSGSLLTGQLYVAMDFFPQAPAAKLDWSKTPLVLPTVPGMVDDLQRSLLAVARKLETLPINEMAGDLRKAMQSMDKTLQSVEKMAQQSNQETLPELRQTLQGLQQTLATTQQLLAPDAPLPSETRQAMQELAKSAQAMRTLAEMLEREPQSLLRGRSTPAKIKTTEVKAAEVKVNDRADQSADIKKEQP